MATLVLGGLGTIVGGPLGGAIGASLGRNLDQMIIGSPRREGPRLNDLAISTSSYGQPIPALYGTVRTAGTVIWATDLKEHRETSGGGKGRPKTTSYSYTVSLAVALSSRPIERIGRIWADGNLLRGVAGDLKSGGTLRSYTGLADQQPDPLMAADIGSRCPAHRGCAYVVFEDLALEDFGNRIPALSFEVFAGTATDLVAETGLRHGVAAAGTAFPELEGFVHEGGDDASVLALVDRLAPIAATSRSGQLWIEGILKPDGEIATLPEPSGWAEGDFGAQVGHAFARKSQPERPLSALRYYDPSRDFQPGLQRAEGIDGTTPRQLLEFPGVFPATAAKELLSRAAIRDGHGRERLAWRISELNPGLGPGTIVRAPGQAGLWMIAAWEWRESGIELELERYVAETAIDKAADSGKSWSPPDREGVETHLRVFELPLDGTGAGGSVQRFAAVGAQAGRWPGATLYREEAGALIPVGSASRRTVSGTLAVPLPSSSGFRLETDASLQVLLDDEESWLDPATALQLARGANRLLVGAEIVQFAAAEPMGDGQWLLTGLLRGRGGTEPEAMAGHTSGVGVTLLDENLVALPGEGTPSSYAAIGLNDEEPVFAAVEGVGRTRRPLLPVHPRAWPGPDGTLHLSWVRRARGGWTWLDEVEQPLVEEAEAYEVGIGAPDRPLRLWQTASPEFEISPAALAELASQYPGEAVWVRQRGTFARSRALHLALIPPAN